MTTVCIVGASLSGFRTAAALRNQGFDGQIYLVGAEKHLPYDRPPLSKSMLISVAEEPPRWLTSGEELASLNIDITLGVAAQRLSRLSNGWRVDLINGDRIDADIVVVATGAVARQPLKTNLTGVHTLRTLDDHRELHDALLRASDLVVVGGGFIGCEVAAAARTHGVSVTVVEALPEPLARVLGEEVGATCASLLRGNGVRVLCRQNVTDITGNHGRATGVRLANGETVPADIVLVGVGAKPATEWLADSAVTVGDGVLCDQYGAATGVTGVFALGDAARWWHPAVESAIRVEHWSNVSEQANIVAANIIHHRSRALSTVPYVWSDQFGKKLQIVGWPSPGCQINWIERSDEDHRATALYGQEGIVMAAFAIGNPQFAARARRLVADRTPIDEAISELTPVGRVHIR